MHGSSLRSFSPGLLLWFPACPRRCRSARGPPAPLPAIELSPDTFPDTVQVKGEEGIISKKEKPKKKDIDHTKTLKTHPTPHMHTAIHYRVSNCRQVSQPKVYPDSTSNAIGYSFGRITCFGLVALFSAVLTLNHMICSNRHTHTCTVTHL